MIDYDKIKRAEQVDKMSVHEGYNKIRVSAGCSRGVPEGPSLTHDYFQVRSTWPDDVIPGEYCLPYDGSKVPDCTQYVDPDNYIPYYHEHSSSEITLYNFN